MPQENEKNAARFEKNANWHNKMRLIGTKNAAWINTSVQAIGKHKQFICRHLSTAVDSNINEIMI